jgi:signal transduction histidine kinase
MDEGAARVAWENSVERESPWSASRERHIADEDICHPPARSHAVQFYADEAFLIESVYAFVGSGLRAGDQVLAIATQAHLAALTARLGAAGLDPAAAARSGQLLAMDAEQVLSRVMAVDVIDLGSFRAEVARAFSTLYGAAYRRELGAATSKPIGIRIYGELVDMLARGGNARAAILVEELWNEICQRDAFAMLCTYDLGSFQRAADAEHHSRVCECHTHVLPAEGFTRCVERGERWREVSRLQQRDRALEDEVRQRAELESELRTALEAQRHLQDELQASMKREREARARADASLAFKELFFGVLGHDLRNPLNTILTTTRMMLMRDSLEPETQKRLNRVVTSGERMHRMIEQILDATRTRLNAGIAVELGEPCDLVPLVTDIVSEVRAARPSLTVHLDAPLSCKACIDPRRFGQVLATLLDNAAVHGDPARPIEVYVAVRDAGICIGVHNYGKPIDAETYALLFEPFKRGGRPAGRSSGLGLGLYISQHIVRAHGGSIAVESSYESGTRFEIRLPRP